MKFGAFVPQGWRWDLGGIPLEDHWPIMLEVAKLAEASGFESVWAYDHFQNSPPSQWAEYVWRKATDPDWVNSLPETYKVPVPTQEATYEAWALMSALAATTDTVRLGQMCTCNTYRPPSYLAKVAASIDVISSGRLEMGIGAGWYEHEHDGYGYEFLSPGRRLGMLREGVEIMKAMWTEDVVDYEGAYYTLQGAICQPKPVQEPLIPFWIAGGGEKVTLNIAARYARYTNFGGDDLDKFQKKSEILEKHCADVGSDFEAITRSANFNILCAETEAGVQEKKDRLLAHLKRYVPAEAAERTARLYDRASGTPEQVIEWLQRYEDAGMSYAIVYFADAAHDRTSLELFAKEVIPALQ